MRTDTAQILYLFASDGTCATIPVQQLPQVHNPAEGTPFRDQCGFKNGETITAALALPPSLEDGLLFMATHGGEVKRLKMQDLPGMMAHVFKVMDVEQHDRLGWVFATSGKYEMVLVTAQGQAIRFKESDVRPTGLGAGGMRGIKLGSTDDRVIGAGIVGADTHIWTITDNGMAKSTPMDEYPTQGRAGSGVITMKLPKDSRCVAAAAVGTLDDTLIVLSSKHRPKAMRLGLAPSVKRAAKAESVMTLYGNEEVGAVVTYQQIALDDLVPAGADTEAAVEAEVG
jgi:DNA gyrase subunit A